MKNLDNYFLSIDDYIFCPPILTMIKHHLNCEQAVIYKLDKQGELENIIYASEVENRYLKQKKLEQINDTLIAKKVSSFIQKKEDEDTVPLITSELMTPIHLKTPEIIALNDRVSLWGILLVYDYNYLRAWKPAEHEYIDQMVQEMTLAIERSIIYQKFKQLEKTVRSQEIFDEQTGLINYSSFLDCLNYEWHNLARIKQELSLILLDFSEFLNQSDQTITQEIAQIVQEQVKRPADIVAYYQNNQIIIMLPLTDNSGALWVNRQIMESLKNYDQGNHNYQCRSSILTCIPKLEKDYQWLLQTLQMPLSDNSAQQKNIYNQNLE